MVAQIKLPLTRRRILKAYVGRTPKGGWKVRYSKGKSKRDGYLDVVEIIRTMGDERFGINWVPVEIKDVFPCRIEFDNDNIILKITIIYFHGGKRIGGEFSHSLNSVDVEKYKVFSNRINEIKTNIFDAIDKEKIKCIAVHKYMNEKHLVPGIFNVIEQKELISETGYSLLYDDFGKRRRVHILFEKETIIRNLLRKSTPYINATDKEQISKLVCAIKMAIDDLNMKPTKLAKTEWRRLIDFVREKTGHAKLAPDAFDTEIWGTSILQGLDITGFEGKQRKFRSVDAREICKNALKQGFGIELRQGELKF
jgi:hypothetical protein